MTRTITALFDSRADAEVARQRVEDAGIDVADLHIADKSTDGHSDAGYSTHENRYLSLLGSTARLEIDNAFAYEGQRLRVAKLVDGRAETAERTLPAKNQFALELDHFARCVTTGATPRTPGEEGAQDHVVMEAIYAAAKTGRRVELPRIMKLDAFRGPEPADP